MNLLMQTIRALLYMSMVLLSSLVTASEYVTYLHSDIHGSPVVATNEQGQVVWQESYAPWGQREIKDMASANPALGSKTWYTGKEEEEALGLYYYGARWYSPDIGQFYSIDPAPVTLENPRSFGRYLYANNNPLLYKDPDGRTPVLAIGAYMGFVALTAGVNAAVQKFMYGDVQVRGVGGVLDAAGDAAVMGPLAIPMGVRGAGARQAEGAANGAEQTVVRTTRSGDKAVRVTKQDGSVTDISPKRVKEYLPNTHPNAPPGALDKVKFPNAQPGSKGYKRDPTSGELETLRNAK